MASQEKSRTIARRLVNNAKDSMGGGWNHISPAIRRAIVMDAVVGVVCGQDESIDPKNVVALLSSLVSEVDGILGA